MPIDAEQQKDRRLADETLATHLCQFLFRAVAFYFDDGIGL